MKMTPVRLITGVLLANLAAQWIMSLCWSLEPMGSGRTSVIEWHAFGWFHWSGRLIAHSIVLWCNWDWVVGVFAESADAARELRKVA